MKIKFYPSLSEVLELHEILIEKFGGKKGVRDLGLLESALWRPQTGYYKTLSLEAAALLQSLTQNDLFVDGNKRVAFATTAIFLRMNGYRLKVTSDEGERFIVKDLIAQKINIDKITLWIEKHLHKIKLNY